MLLELKRRRRKGVGEVIEAGKTNVRGGAVLEYGEGLLGLAPALMADVV